MRGLSDVRGTVRLPVLGLVTLAVSAVFAVFVSGAMAVDVQHGIGLTKGCTSPTKIGDPYSCSYTVRNILDEAEDTLTISSLVDVVHAASGDVSSNIIGAAQITTTTDATGTTPSGATCVAASGNGVFPTPYTGVTSCTLPFGSRVNVLSFSHYTVQALDFTLPNHQLRDDVFLTWGDLCNDPAGTGNSNCDPTPPDVGASSLSLIQQLNSSTATDIHNAAHAVVTAVAVGTTVHDFVTVTGQPGSPVPTGNVSIDWFLNGDCSGAPAQNSGPVGPLNASGQFDATGFAFTVNTTGARAFRAHYLGDPTYAASDGACEPLQVVGAKITIAPDATNEVGAPHTFTVTLQKDVGAGFVPAAGEHVDVTLTDSNGAAHTAPTGTCTNAGANTDAAGQCTITFSSPTAGKVTGHATSTLSVNGSPITVATDGVAPNSGDAVKTFVDANIQITPPLATNPVGTNHVFTGHVNVNSGTGGFVNAPDGTQISFTIDSGPGAFTTANPCTTAGGTGSCTITLSSAVTGTTVVSAHTTVSVGGVSLHRDTNGVGANSGAATKLWADDTVRTDIHDPAHAVITTAAAGTVVHDKVFVTRTAGTPALVPDPTGNVVFHRYVGLTCSGASVDETVALAADGTAESSAFTTVGDMSYQAHYNGDANYPARDGACEPLAVQSGGLITDTNVTCGDVLSGNASNFLIGQINYPNNNGKIGQGINPGKFFYWAKITTTIPNQVVTVTQSKTGTGAGLFQIGTPSNWARVYTGDCASFITMTVINGGTGASVVIPTPGNYIIGIKYDPKSLVGLPVPTPPTVTYTFTTSLGSSTEAKVDLGPNP